MFCAGGVPYSGGTGKDRRLAVALNGQRNECLPAAVGHSSARKEMRRRPHEWPEKQPGVKKKQNFCGLNPILWRFAAEEGAIRADDQSWCPTVAEFALHR